MTKKDEIEQDLKQAMLAGNKDQVMILRGLKSAILYVEVAENKRETGLNDDEVIALLQKESKKRQESADLYRQGNDEVRAAREDLEKKIIEKYLPAQLGEQEILKVVEAEIAKLDNPSVKDMGSVIGAVKAACGGAADGAVIARLTKEKLG